MSRTKKDINRLCHQQLPLQRLQDISISPLNQCFHIKPLRYPLLKSPPFNTSKSQCLLASPWTKEGNRLSRFLVIYASFILCMQGVLSSSSYFPWESYNNCAGGNLCKTGEKQLAFCVHKNAVWKILKHHVRGKAFRLISNVKSVRYCLF